MHLTCYRSHFSLSLPWLRALQPGARVTPGPVGSLRRVSDICRGAEEGLPPPRPVVYLAGSHFVREGCRSEKRALESIWKDQLPHFISRVNPEERHLQATGQALVMKRGRGSWGLGTAPLSTSAGPQGRAAAPRSRGEGLRPGVLRAPGPAGRPRGPGGGAGGGDHRCDWRERGDRSEFGLVIPVSVCTVSAIGLVYPGFLLCLLPWKIGGVLPRTPRIQ